MEFVTWETLGSSTGALGMVLILTQLTKELPLIGRLPTQLWSYVLALLVLIPQRIFSGGLDVSGTVLLLFNAGVLALAANGGYDAIVRAMGDTGTGE